MPLLARPCALFRALAPRIALHHARCCARPRACARIAALRVPALTRAPVVAFCVPLSARCTPQRFTEKAIKVVMLAQEEARRLGHNFVGTEQARGKHAVALRARIP
jgi:hypothetical protein